MAAIKGINYSTFTRHTSNELQPGSVPGPGGHHDLYKCKICGFEVWHQVFGRFFDGDEEKFFRALITSIEFHAERCKEVTNEPTDNPK